MLRPWLGVYPQPVTESLRRAFGLPDRHGALVAEVYDSSPARQAGLEAGDVIVDFDGRRVERADDLMWLLGITEERSVPLRYYRQGSAHNVTVTLRPESPPPAEAPGPTRKPSSLGIAVSEMTQQIAQKLGYDEEHGLVVLTVEAGSPAMDAGVERGDVVLRVNDRQVDSLDDYVKAVSAIPAGEVLRLLVRREDRKQWHNFWLAFTRR